MTSRSKQKGSSHERDVAEILTAWHGKKFQRVPNSGALRWGAQSAWHYGDILPPQDFPFVIEAKHWASVTFDDVLGRRLQARPGKPALPASFGTGQVAGWWYDQAIPDAVRATAELSRSVEPMLVWKEDFHRIRICLDDALYREISCEIRKNLVCCWVYIPERKPFICLDFEHFLAAVTAEELLLAFSAKNP